MIANDDNERVAAALLDVHSASLEALAEVDSYQFFSDSVFVFCACDERVEANSERSFNQVAKCVRELIKNSVAEDLFFRGSLSFGRMTFRQHILIGKPMLRAYQREQSLPYPLVIVPEAEMVLGRVEHILPATSIETKTGIISAAVILPSRRGAALNKAVELARAALVNGPDHVAQSWDRYVRILQRALTESGN